MSTDKRPLMVPTVMNVCAPKNKVSWEKEKKSHRTKEGNQTLRPLLLGINTHLVVTDGTTRQKT